MFTRCSRVGCSWGRSLICRQFVLARILKLQLKTSATGYLWCPKHRSKNSDSYKKDRAHRTCLEKTPLAAYERAYWLQSIIYGMQLLQWRSPVLSRRAQPFPAMQQQDCSVLLHSHVYSFQARMNGTRRDNLVSEPSQILHNSLWNALPQTVRECISSTEHHGCGKYEISQEEWRHDCHLQVYA